MGNALLLSVRAFGAVLPLAVAASSAIAALSTTLRDYPAVSATMDVADGQCPRTVSLVVRAGSADELKHGSRALSKIAAWAQLNVQMTCPQSDAIRVSGFVDGARLYNGKALRSENWALVETSDPSPDAGMANAQPPGSVIARTPATPPSGDSRTPGVPAEPTATPAVALQIASCDRLGSHPDDPEAMAPGIPDEKIDAQAVAKACEEAVRANPSIPRLRFQLARAYIKANRIEAAVDHLIAAAQEGHGGALAYLADLRVDGVAGLEADPVLARTLYEKAAASGFAPAKSVLSEFEDMTDAYAQAESVEQEAEKLSGGTAQADLKPYALANVIENIYSRKFDDIIYHEIWIKHYLFNIADNIRAVCEAHFTQQEVNILKAEAGADHYRIGQAAVGAALLGTMAILADAMKNPGAYTAQSGGSVSEDPFEVAMKDTEALFQRHRCKTPGLARFSKNLAAFVKNEEAPLPAPDQIFNACLRNPPPSKYVANQFCSCFAGGLDKARVSQKHRKNLVENFRETAIEIMNIDRNQGQFRVCRAGF